MSYKYLAKDENLKQVLVPVVHDQLDGIQGDGYYHLSINGYNFVVTSQADMPLADGYFLTSSAGGTPVWIEQEEPILDHNSLLNIEGGSALDGYYHLTGTEHTWITDGPTTGYWTVSKGGTGQTTYSAGDMLYAPIADTLDKLPIGPDGYVLTVISAMPSWEPIVTGIDPVQYPTDLAPIVAPVGGIAYVESLRCYYVYDVESTLSADAHNIVASIYGGNWLRQDPPDDTWKQQTTWYINPTTGNDLSSGIDSPNAIQTLAEWRRRTGGFVKTDVNVHLEQNIPITDPLPGKIGVEGPGSLVFNGTLTQLSTGTITGYLPFDATTQPIAQLSDNTPQDWSAFVGYLVYIVEQDIWLRVVRDLGGGDCLITPAAYYYNMLMYYGIVTPIVGNTYIVYSTSEVFTPIPYSDTIDSMIIDAQDYTVVFTDLTILSSCGYSPSMTSESGYSMFLRCDIGIDYTFTLNGKWQLFCTRSASPIPTYPGQTGGVVIAVNSFVDVWAHVALTDPASSYAMFNLDKGGIVNISRGGLFLESSSFSIVRGSLSVNGPLVCNNSYGYGVELATNTDCYITSAGYILGSGNANYGLTIRAGSKVYCATSANCKITGDVNMDFIVGDSEDLLPDITQTLPQALYHCTTWAEFAAAPFSGTAINYNNGAYLGPETTITTPGPVAGYWLEAQGGTGQTTYSAGDILYGDPITPNTLAKLPIGNDGYVLMATPTGPEWTYSSPSNYLLSFVDGDLDLSGNITITHNLGNKYVMVEVYDENDSKVIPESVVLVDSNSCTVNLASMQPLIGTWHAVVYVGGTIPSARSVNRWFFTGGSETTSSTGWVTIGAAYIDPTNGPPTSYLRCVLECTNASYPCVVRLYNSDDSTAVGGSSGEITETALTPTLNTLALIAGTTVGFPYAPKLYFFQIKMSGGAPPESVACKNAVVEQS